MMVDVRQREAARPLKPSEAGLPPVVAPGVSFRDLTDRVTANVLQARVPVFWFTVFAIATLSFCVLWASIAALMGVGVGLMGYTIPVAWAFPIANYVWWIEIAVGGSLLSSILRLANQSWRNSINRLAEGVTLAGISCAGLFPCLHLGRVWILYWLLPYPNTMTIQPNFRSPLIWDVFGLTTYFAASILFWYLDLIPDLASVRDRAQSRTAYIIYGFLCLGWTGSSRQWRIQERSSILFAGILTPLVFTIHTVVSFDFAIGLLPGWHSTIFPPYFVDGAIMAGLSMVLMMAIPLRTAFHLQSVITERHLNNLAKLILTTSVILCYVYVIEPFTAWYGGDPFEMWTVHARGAGPFAWTYWSFVVLGLGVPQLFWWKANRSDTRRMFWFSFLIIVGMWQERYMLMTTSLSQDFVPSSWANFAATAEDNLLLYGSIGQFLLVLFLLVKLLPMIPMHGVRELLPFSKPDGGTVK